VSALFDIFSYDHVIWSSIALHTPSSNDTPYTALISTGKSLARIFSLISGYVQSHYVWRRRLDNCTAAVSKSILSIVLLPIITIDTHSSHLLGSDRQFISLNVITRSDESTYAAHAFFIIQLFTPLFPSLGWTITVWRETLISWTRLEAKFPPFTKCLQVILGTRGCSLRRIDPERMEPRNSCSRARVET
jgi:hypothetical protein